MDTEILRGELERMFELDGLVELCRDVLGMQPEEIGSTGSKASFARALVERCSAAETLDALVDGAETVKGWFEPRVLERIMFGRSFRSELKFGETIGPYTISRKIGDGPSGAVYVARNDARDFVLKVLHPEAVQNRASFARFAALCRLVARVQHESLPGALALNNFDGVNVISYEHVEGQTLASRITRSGPMHINEARQFLRGVLDALSTLHQQRIVHGNLKAENILMCRGEGGKTRVVLLDAGMDRLRMLRSRAAEPGASDIFIVVAGARTMAPEQVCGERVTPSTDVYAFGVIMHEVLTGKPLFGGNLGPEFAAAHLTGVPLDPIAAAPRGWVTKEVASFLSSLLARDPSARPKNAALVLEDFEKLGRAATEGAQRKEDKIPDEELQKRIEALDAAPTDKDAAAALDAAVEQGADAMKVARAFLSAATQIPAEDQERKEARKGLLFGAARLFETNLHDIEEAEKAYERILEGDPHDDVAQIALESARKQLGKYEDVIEMLLARVELSNEPEERADAMAEIGRIYHEELDDSAQAAVAYAKAFSEAPAHSEYADRIESCAGSNMQVLGDAIAMLAEATRTSSQPELNNPIFLRLANWYQAKLGRSDAALPCLQAVVATDPGNDAALDAMTGLFRSTQQYSELGQVLLRRVEAASNPARARDLRCEAAELLELRLNEPLKAKELYEQVLQADPGHAKAADALLRMYEKDGNLRGVVGILEGRLDGLQGSDRTDATLKLGELYEELKEAGEATRCFELALSLDSESQRALKGLEQIYTIGTKYQELLANLERQAGLAATPRQKIGFLDRIAKLWEEEFLDHKNAAQALERIVEIDPASNEALGGLAKHYRALGKWEDVAGVYERHLRIATDKSQRVDLLLTLARVLADQVAAPERAMKAYEEVLEIDPQHAGALEALAALREQAGDAQAALKAIEALAAKAATPKEKAEHFIRAARLLEGREDAEGAMQQYKLALEANPREASASSALRKIYLDRGEFALAVELIVREMEFADSQSVKARLAAEIAKISRERVKDDSRAENAAKAALVHDATQIDALTILGDISYEAERFVEAQHHYESVASRIDLLQKDAATRVLRRYIESLARIGSADKALSFCDRLRELNLDDLQSLQVVAKVVFDHGDAGRAFQLHQELLEKAGNQLVGREKSAVLYRHGEAARRAGDALSAGRSLSEAADMDPLAAEPLASLAKLQESKGDWEEVIRVKNRRLDVATGDERVDILVEIGEICASKLNDKTRASKSLAAALEQRPDDRKLLTRLMQLYSENKDWSRLVEVVLKLADFVDDKKQKAKYFHTASLVTAEQLGDADKALEYIDKVLELDPTEERALEEAIVLRRDKSDSDGVEKLLKTRLERATVRDDREAILKTFDDLGDLYQNKLGWIGEAIDAYEAAQVLEPNDAKRNDRLAGLYASNAGQYLDKAVAAQQALLRSNTKQAQPYKLLRKLYTEAKQADSAWCLCQALSVLGFAEPDEERFFRRHRAEASAVAQTSLTEDDWIKLVIHPDADPILTAILAILEPTILATRAETLENLGYDPRYAIDLTRHPYPISQMIYYATGVLGMEPPPTFQNVNDSGGISFLHAQIPSIVLGSAAFEIELPQQQAAYMVARHLAYYRPGLYVRHLVPTGTGLRAWVFAAIRMNAPQFPVAADLEGPVNENIKAITTHLTGPAREMLASLVSKLLQTGGSLDLKRWIAAVDLTADRVGFIIAHDLSIGMDMVKLSDESSSPLGHNDRISQLILFSVSEQYFELRRKLGIGID